MLSLTTGSQPHEAFLLLNLSGATLRTPTNTQTGTLNLECVTITIPHGGRAPTDRAVYLVLRLDTFEAPIDPARVVHRSSSASGQRIYTFDGTDEDPSDLVITFPAPKPDSLFDEDLATFDGILAQYADLRRSDPAATPTGPAVQETVRAAAAAAASSASGVPTATSSGGGGGGGSSLAKPGASHDLRGQLVLINEVNGEVVGEVDGTIRIQEDPRLREHGRENDSVIIEVAEDGEMGALELFALAIPSEEQDWMTKSATIISHAISSTTSLLLTTITTASSHYIAKSAPSVHNPTATTTANPNAPPPLPPRALMLLTSETTRKGLSGVHAVSGHAVNVSHKTVSLINRMIERAVGAKGKQGLRHYANSSLSPGAVPPRASSPSHVPPPPYSPSADKPPPSPRRVPSPSPATSSSATISPPIPPRIPSPQPPPLPMRRLRTRDRVILSADLILSTLDESAKQIVEVGGDQLSAVLGHKFGPAAAENSLLVTGAARNLVLVYIDMRGIGRRALLRKTGRKFVKARLSSRKY